MSTPSRLVCFDKAEHLDVLFERQRDVDVIDPLLPDDFAAFGQRAEQRQAAIADVIAGARSSRKPTTLNPSSRCSSSLSATSRPRSPAPAISTRLSPMPARQRRSSASRTSSRDV